VAFSFSQYSQPHGRVSVRATLKQVGNSTVLCVAYHPRRAASRHDPTTPVARHKFLFSRPATTGNSALRRAPTARLWRHGWRHAEKARDFRFPA